MLYTKKLHHLVSVSWLFAIFKQCINLFFFMSGTAQFSRPMPIKYNNKTIIRCFKFYLTSRFVTGILNTL